MTRVGPTKVLTPLSGAGSMAMRGMFCFPLWWITETATGVRRCACPKAVGCGRNSGKHPRFENWQAAASIDQKQVKAMFVAEPSINYGIFTGASRIVVLDADQHHADADGLETLRRLEDLLGEPLARTWATRTPNDGLHLPYTLPEDFDWRTERLISNLSLIGLGPGVDVLWGGKLVVGVGSYGLNGKQYTPLGGEDGIVPWDMPRDARPTPISPNLLDLLRRPARTAVAVPGTFGPANQTVLAKLAERAKLGRGVTPSGMIQILCPWARAAGYAGGHDGTGDDTSTVLTGAMSGQRLGGLICQHSNKCPERTSAEMLELFSRPDPRWPDGPAWIREADAELDAAGVEPRSTAYRRSIPDDPSAPEAIVEDATNVSQATLDAGPPPDRPASDPVLPGDGDPAADDEPPDYEPPPAPEHEYGPEATVSDADDLPPDAEPEDGAQAAADTPPPGTGTNGAGEQDDPTAGPWDAAESSAAGSYDPTAGSDDPGDVVRLTDLGNARRLVAAYDSNLHYCKAWKTWLVWDGGAGRVTRTITSCATPSGSRRRSSAKRQMSQTMQSCKRYS
jgi:hypothetical protein